MAVALYERELGTIRGRVNFRDTDDDNVRKMAYLGVVTGIGGNRFAPNNPITREAAAVFLSRLAEAMGHPLPDQSPQFADNGHISGWAVEGVGQMQATGIMGGVSGNRFAPHSPYTREQSIITMLRLLNIIDPQGGGEVAPTPFPTPIITTPTPVPSETIPEPPAATPLPPNVTPEPTPSTIIITPTPAPNVPPQPTPPPGEVTPTPPPHVVPTPPPEATPTPLPQATPLPATPTPVPTPTPEPTPTPVPTFPQSGLTLPDRRATDAERAEWIAEYWAMGGPFEFEREVVRLINEVRIEHGLAYLQMDYGLMMAARYYTQLQANLNTDSGHNQGPYRVENAAHGASANVALAFGNRLGRWNGGNSAAGGSALAQDLVNRWMNSPGHRNYILSPEHRFIGAGSHIGGRWGVFHYLFMSNLASE